MKRIITLAAMVLAPATTVTGAAIAGTTGTYKVPDGQYLDQDVLLRTSKANVNENNDGTIEISYKLPRELDGADPRTIKLQSVSATNRLQIQGPEGVGVCEPVSQSFSCTISYFKDSADGTFALNTEAAATYMQSRNFSPERIQLMEKAQQSIMHEAAGILFIKKR
jgi:hypothetical protein